MAPCWGVGSLAWSFYDSEPIELEQKICQYTILDWKSGTFRENHSSTVGGGHAVVVVGAEESQDKNMSIFVILRIQVNLMNQERSIELHMKDFCSVSSDGWNSGYTESFPLEDRGYLIYQMDLPKIPQIETRVSN